MAGNTYRCQPLSERSGNNSPSAHILATPPNVLSTEQLSWVVQSASPWGDPWSSWMRLYVGGVSMGAEIHLSRARRLYSSLCLFFFLLWSRRSSKEQLQQQNQPSRETSCIMPAMQTNTARGLSASMSTVSYCAVQRLCLLLGWELSPSRVIWAGWLMFCSCYQVHSFSVTAWNRVSCLLM